MNKKLISMVVVWIIVVSIRLALYAIEKLYGYYIIWDDIYIYLTYLILVIPTLFTVSYIQGFIKNRWVTRISVSLAVASLVLIIITNSYGNPIKDPIKRYYFVSKDGTNKLLLEEQSSITDCSVRDTKLKIKYLKERMIII